MKKVADNHTYMGVGMGAKTPLGIRKYQQKKCFLSFEREKTNFKTFGRPP